MVNGPFACRSLNFLEVDSSEEETLLDEEERRNVVREILPARSRNEIRRREIFASSVGKDAANGGVRNGTYLNP